MSTFSLKALGDDSPLPLPSFSWLLAILSIPWFVDASLQSLLLSSHGNLSVCLYAIFLLCMWIFVSSYDILPFMWMYLNFLIFKNASYWTGAYLSRGWSHLNSLTSAKTEFLYFILARSQLHLKCQTQQGWICSCSLENPWLLLWQAGLFVCFL